MFENVGKKVMVVLCIEWQMCWMWLWRCVDEEGSWREMRECEKEGERLACL